VVPVKGIDPAPGRVSTTSRSFIRQQAAGIMACDLFTVDTTWLTRSYVLLFIEVGTRGVHLYGMTANPTGRCVTQQARNQVAGLGDQESVGRHLIRDRDTKITRPFDDVWRQQRPGLRTRPELRIRTPTRNAGSALFVGNASITC
jgi:putative transposase